MFRTPFAPSSPGNHIPRPPSALSSLASDSRRSITAWRFAPTLVLLLILFFGVISSATTSAQTMGTVTATVLDRNRQPIGGAEVHLRDIDKGNFIGPSGTSDPTTGQATITNVPPGRYDIGAYKIDNAVPGYNQWIFSPNSAGYLVTAGNTTGPIEIVLDKTDTHTGGVFGFVRYDDGTGAHPIGLGVHIEFYNGGHLESTADSTANGQYTASGFNCINIDGAHPNWGWHTYIATWNGHTAIGRNFGTWPGVPIRMDIAFTFPSALGDAPVPAWAERVIPTDTVPAGASGPSAADSVNLATGIYENRPDPDLVVRNPVGPNPLFARRYHSLEAAKGRATPGLSIGWKHNYDVTIQADFPGTWGSLKLSYPNGAKETINVSGSPPTPSAPTGAPYFVYGNPSGTTGQWNSLTLTFKDQSSWTFTPDPSNPNNYLLTKIANLVGRYITLNYDTNKRLTSVVDDSNPANALLTLAYDPSSGYLTSISDVPGGRTVLYQFGTMPDNSTLGLTVVSQINKPLTSPRWQYVYQLVNGAVLLASASVPNPSGGTGTTGNSLVFNSMGQCTVLRDASGNTRYHVFGTPAFVQVVGTDGTTESWQQSFSGASNNSGADTGQTDSNGKSSVIYYDDANNKYRETRVVNKNTQTTTLAYDAGATTYVGNLTSITVPTSTGGTLTTTYTYGRYDLSPLGLLISVQEGSKTPTQFTYYDGTTTVDDVLQPRGLLQSIISPMPGSTTGQTVTTTYSYTALGNIAKIVAPAPNGTQGATETTVYNYTFDPLGSYAKNEGIDEPVTVTVPQDLSANPQVFQITHFRYDSRGNVVAVIDALGNETDYQYDDAKRLTRITYPATGQSGPGRAFTLITYNYTNGAPFSIQVFDESGNALPAGTKILGTEGQSLGQTGALQDLTLQRDRQFRLAKIINGKNEARTYGYDSVGNLTRVTFPGTDSIQITGFDSDGNPTQRTDGLGRITNCTRSPFDESLTEVHYVGDSGHDQYLTYDQYGRVTKVQHGADVSHLIDTIEYTYDDLDDILSVKTTYQDGNSNPLFTPKTITYSYFPDGSRSQMATPLGNFNYTYDDAANMITVNCFWAPGGNFTYDYDLLNRIFHQRHSRANTYYDYNPRGFLIGLRNLNTLDGSTLSTFTNMLYDAVGNLLQASVSLPRQGAVPQDFSGTIFYFYDSKNRLTEEKRRLSDNQLLYDYFFTPDGADNRTTARSVVFGFNSNDQITSDGGNQYVYDGNGNPTTYQSVGGIVYDFENRTTFIPGYLTMDWRGDGRRAWKQGVSGQQKEYFLYDGDQVVCELDPAGNGLRAYGYGPSGLMQRMIIGPSGVPIGFTFDPFGHLVQRHTGTGSSFIPIDTAVYDSVGQLFVDLSTGDGLAKPVSDPIGPGAQAGVYTDEETRTTQTTGLALVLSGYYDARAARYLTRGSEGGNVYAGDRSFFSWHTAGSILAGVAGGIVGVGDPLVIAAFVAGYEALYSAAEGRSAAESAINGATAGVTTWAGGKITGVVGSWIAQSKAGQAAIEAGRRVLGRIGINGGARFRLGEPIAPESSYEWATSSWEQRAYILAQKYGINLRGSGQQFTLRYDPTMPLGKYGFVHPNEPTVINFGGSALASEEELAITIAHELRHARAFFGSGPNSEEAARASQEALRALIRGHR